VALPLPRGAVLLPLSVRILHQQSAATAAPSRPPRRGWPRGSSPPRNAQRPLVLDAKFVRGGERQVPPLVIPGGRAAAVAVVLLEAGGPVDGGHGTDGQVPVHQWSHANRDVLVARAAHDGTTATSRRDNGTIAIA
jgi:hypothetical protein